MPTPPLPSRDDDERVDGTVVLWKEFGYRPFLDGWNEDPAHKGGEDSVEGRWMPLAAYAAMSAYAKTGEEVEGVLIEANLDDAETTPAETVRLLIARANTATVAADLMRDRAETAERERDEARALLNEACGAVLRDYVNDDLLARIDALTKARG